MAKKGRPSKPSGPTAAATAAFATATPAAKKVAKAAQTPSLAIVSPSTPPAVPLALSTTLPTNTLPQGVYTQSTGALDLDDFEDSSSALVERPGATTLNVDAPLEKTTGVVKNKVRLPSSAVDMKLCADLEYLRTSSTLRSLMSLRTRLRCQVLPTSTRSRLCLPMLASFSLQLLPPLKPMDHGQCAISSQFSARPWGVSRSSLFRSSSISLGTTPARLGLSMVSTSRAPWNALRLRSGQRLPSSSCHANPSLTL